ncbi:MAG: hypothetical protein AAB606_02225 [Patescibacteria group bacterium]
MSFARIKETFLRLPKQMKLIGAGSLILAISTLLPWYADLDAYRIGDQFLGITGPASFVGIVILLISGFSLWVFSYRLLERKVPRLPVREGILHLFVAVESIFLLILVNSIYFHPKFGVNITLKESRFGMTIAVVGAVVLFIGGYLKNKQEVMAEEDIGKLEPLIKIEQTPQASANPPAYARPHAPVNDQAKRMLAHAKENAHGFLFGEGRAAHEARHAAAAPQQHAPSAPAPGKKDDSGKPGYMIRMDL